MALFKRALWHSGLTYRVTCNKCGTVIQYTDDKLDFRPWYPDGFVYCPVCRVPLRHNEMFAVNEDGTYKNVEAAKSPLAPEAAAQAAAQRTGGETSQSSGGKIAFCPNCGRKYNTEGTNFCVGCGYDLRK